SDADSAASAVMAVEALASHWDERGRDILADLVTQAEAGLIVPAFVPPEDQTALRALVTDTPTAGPAIDKLMAIFSGACTDERLTEVTRKRTLDTRLSELVTEAAPSVQLVIECLRELGWARAGTRICRLLPRLPAFTDPLLDSLGDPPNGRNLEVLTQLSLA